MLLLLLLGMLGRVMFSGARRSGRVRLRVAG